MTDSLTEAAERVVALYPTIAGTSILIRDANRHVPRNAWDDVADAVHALGEVLRTARATDSGEDTLHD